MIGKVAFARRGSTHEHHTLIGIPSVDHLKPFNSLGLLGFNDQQEKILIPAGNLKGII